MKIKSKGQAASDGEKYYYTGKPCIRGHLSKRQVSDGSCYECKKAKHREYYRADPEYYTSRSAVWRSNNPDYHYQYTVKWREENKSRAYATNRNYHFRKTRALPEWADSDEIAYIYELARETGCVVDHIVPLHADKVCGLHTGDNLRVVPAKLNAFKGNRYWPDMPEDL